MAIQPKATDTIKVNAIEAKTGSTLSITPILLIDVIKEKTSSARTTLFHGIKTDTIVEKTGGAKVDFPDDIKTDIIAESTSATGVTIDGVLLKDNFLNTTLTTYTPTITPTNITTTISGVAGRYIKFTNKLVWFEVSWLDTITSTTSTFWYEDVPLPIAADNADSTPFILVSRNESTNLPDGVTAKARVSWGSGANARVFFQISPSGTYRRSLSGIYIPA